MKNIINKKRTNILRSLSVLICVLTLIAGIYISYNTMLADEEIANVETIEYNSSRVSDRFADFKQLFLSDLVPIEKKIGYGQLVNDADMSGNPVVMIIEGNYFSFKKSVFAHATSTLVYDISEYDEYNYFTSFIGLNKTSSGGNGVIFHFYTSEDGKNWEEAIDPVAKLPRTEASFVEIPLENVNYLKLVVDSNGGNGQDHSVFADAKLVNEVNGNFILDSVEDLDKEIDNIYNGQTSVEGELEHVVLKRELVKRVGKYTINSFFNESEENEAALAWLLEDKSVLNYYILGGTPDGNSYYNSLTQLSRLYKAYKNDFKIQETTEYGTVLGDMYTRMAIALSLTHSQRVGLWMQSGEESNRSDAVDRYQIFKDLHKNGKFKATETMNMTKWFEQYNVENMRFVMNSNIDDESILWLNEYVQSKIDAEPGRAWSYLTPHPYMAYVWPNYSNPIFYDDDNYDYFNELFAVNGKKLYDYGITRGTNDHKVYKQWMNFRNKFGTGAVCGGISKSGAVIRATHGIAATVIGQPGHAALLFYTADAEGNGYWRLDNDVSGWTLSEKGERMLLGWGNGTYAKGSYQVVYMALAQEVLNDYENFEKAEKLIMLARSFSDNPNKQEELLRKAIEIQPINIDAWLDLITLYNNSDNKSENDYYDLAEEIAEDLKYFPLPMYNLTNLIKPKMTSVENTYKFTLLQTRILNLAKSTPNNTANSYTVYQPDITRLEANYLLGRLDSTIATFSFDGVDANKIVLSDRFKNSGIRWDYSLDGKNTWNEVSFTSEEEHKLELTREQIESITAENDIYVHIVGVNYEEKNLYKIDITEGTLPTELFANDLENRIVGVNLNTEWRYSENDSWVSYGNSSPNLTGDKKVQVRQPATGTRLASAPSPIYTFTEDNQPDTRKYIPVSHLTIHAVSTEATSQGGAAIKAIDANYNTRWHSAWNGSDTQRYIVIKLDRSVTLSAVEFVPAGGGNGKIYDGTVYGSLDGENWEVLSSMKNLKYTNQANTIADAIANTKSFEIEDPKEVQYVKIVADRSNANWFAARAFNLYQDITQNPHPTAGVAYSTTELTNGKVVARLVNPSRAITITNNGGSDTYTFSENGEFTFEFVDEYGIEGSATAKVDWIDKDLPDANIDYEIDSNNKISISLDDISEDVYLLDEHDKQINFIKVKDKKVTSVSYLNSAGEVTKTVYVDENGCITKIAYVNTNENIPSVATYVTIMTDGAVSEEEYFDDRGNPVEVSDADREALKGLQQPMTDPLEYTFEESGSHEFKLQDKADNITFKSVKVDYEENTNKIYSSDISYDITHLTNKEVIASIKAYVFKNGQKEDANIITGDETHTFDKNGNFTFKYKDKGDSDDEAREHSAKVTWIDKVAPTAQIKYTTRENGEIVATLTNESEKIIITNNGFSREYVFKKNGEFTFVFEDEAGNVGKATAIVDSIKEEEPEKPDEPEKPTDPVDPVEPDVPVGPSNPDDPVSPTDPSTPSKPSKPVIPFNPSKPNNKPNTDNSGVVEGETDTDNKPSTDNPTKPNDETSTKPSDKDEDREEDKTVDEKKKENHNIIIMVLVLIVIILAGVTAGVYYEYRR